MRSCVSCVVSLVSIFMSLLIGSQAQTFDPNNDTGVHQYETYDGARENVNVGAGNVFISVPLVTLPGRNGHNYSLSLISNSQAWSWAPGWQNLDAGMLVSRGYISVHPSGVTQPSQGIQCVSDYMMSDDNGSVSTFTGMQSDCIWIGGGPNQGMREPQYDVLAGNDDRNEGIHLDISACTLSLKDGTWVPLLSGSGGCPLIGVIGQGSYPPVITDSNGNQITLAAGGGEEVIARHPYVAEVTGFRMGQTPIR